MTASVKNKACLICIDGWGVSPHDDTEGDAIRNAKTPVMDKLSSEYPYLTIGAHGLAVGLPEGLMGNSEVGHLNVGAGRVVYQDIVRIELAVKKNTLAKNPKLLEAFKGSDRVHFLGLVSDGGVHSHIRHLMALVEAAKAYGVPQCFIHFFADGRDTSPKSATTYLRQLLEFLQKINYGTLVDITGRYYAMDRDKRWERVQLAYEGLVAGVGEMVDLSGLEGDKKIDAIIAAVEKRYSQNETDEFLKPLILEQKEGQIRDGDTLLFFNFRSDRMRQITQVFGKIGGSFPFEVKPEFERKNLRITSMTQYKADYPFPVLFEQQKMTNVMGEWLAHLNVPQMHIAETEKYAHVTFFFNGGTETQYHLEERQLIPSPKVATYDLKPEMSAIEVAEAVAAAVKTDKYPFVMMNFAPPDMVGHTGVYDAAIKAVEATDKGIGIIYEACKEKGYVLFITADHGNAEKMLSDDKKTPHTAHTTARVPFIMTSKDFKFQDVKPVGTGEGEGIKETGGALCDVAPTILQVMGLSVPEEMTGESLLA